MTELKTDTTVPQVVASGVFERVRDLGTELSGSLSAVLASLPGAPHGPQSLARTLALDKVLTSRVLKAIRSRDPLATVYHLPGPDPVRRLLKAAGRRAGGSPAVDRAATVVDRFEQLIRREAGDRGSLNAMISAWLPEARREFEVRRKQAAFKAMSQLKGMMSRATLATVLLHPSDDGANIDVIWILGQLGFQRLRSGVTVKFSTRRMTEEGDPRAPRNLEGEPIQSVDDARLDEFCEAPPARIEVRRVDDVLHYVLAGDDFGPGSAVDLVLAEANFAEMPRYVARDSGRLGNVFAEITVPSKMLLFDVFVHESVYPGAEPQLRIYDTALDGVANVNDRTRDIDLLDLSESIRLLGRGLASVRHPKVTSYADLVGHTFRRLGWNEGDFRGYRCEIDYPLYGSQIAMAFSPPPPPGPGAPGSDLTASPE